MGAPGGIVLYRKLQSVCRELLVYLRPSLVQIQPPMSPPGRAGKTAPRLAADINLYDPQNPPSSGRNLLSQVPPVFPGGYNGIQQWISPAACQHIYTTKTNQTILPPQTQRRGAGTTYRVAAVCSKCRYHLQLVVTYTKDVGQISQNQADHIHHFVYKSGRQAGGQSTEEITPKGQHVETFHYECSYLTCSAVASLRIASPLLGPQWVQLLTDPELLKNRADEAINAHPDRLEGVGHPLPINVLENLRTYISNALHDRQRSKSISAVNKRFMVCFGVEGIPCQDLLRFLEFHNGNEGFWEPPRPQATEAPPYHDPFNVFLDDVVHELSALIEQRPPTERKGHQIDQPALAQNDILYALGALNYPRAVGWREFQMPGTPCYEDLGAVEDMSSALVVEAYNRQISVDPSRAPFYLQNLKTVASLRDGSEREVIDQAVMVAYSEGQYTEEDVVKAYKYFGLSHEDPTLTEDSIIGKFYAFLSATTHEAETRKQLWRIGDSRRSEHIKAAAEERVSTPEQALVFLGVDEKTPDDFIVTMYTAKITDSPASKDLARRAVEIIAEARKSETLSHFLKTGETGLGEMDVGDAYRLLQIPDRTVDDAAIMAAYTICVDEAPGQIETYNRALSIIAKDKDSAILGNLVSGSTAQSDRKLSEWPVGLQNIGNTCYLNSLLQFYFTVRPYREMVLDFENHKMDMGEESLSQKQVGSRKVTKNEVERSQRFLRELRTLFQNMITSPSSSVTPSPELARLTLISSTNEAAIRRKSTISGPRPGGLGEINGVAVMGPLGPPKTGTSDESAEQTATAAPVTAETYVSKESTTSDVDSDATLVDSSRNETPGPPADNKENQPPLGNDASEQDIKPTSEEEKDAIATDSQATPGPIGPPNRPPPVPPRPSSDAERQRQLLEEVEIGAQQDVTEVINNVLFQSQCAIKPRAIAPDGEQLDQVKDLFYGRTQSYITAERGVRSKEELWCDIKVDVASGSRDIYAAIDGAFDAQKVHVDGEIAEQFGSISKLPPILQIQVQRVQFDPVKKTSYKSTHHLELKETIYLDRYMDTQQEELMNRRRQCWAWKDTLRVLEARREELLRKEENDRQDMPALFDNAKRVLEDLDAMKDDEETADDAIEIDPQTITELDQLSQITKTELAFVEQEIRDTQAMISSQFADYKHLPYRLYAVFVHHGSVEFGHYYIYIYDFKKDVWRKYNDSDITEVHNRAEIFESQGRNPPTPYFLVYVNERMKDRLVQPVCREIAENSASTAEDTAAQATIPAAAQGEDTVTTSEDVDMDPPAYDEAWTDSGPAGTADASTLDEKRKTDTGGSDAAGTWSFNNEADAQNVEW
ncbi:hypothetical protein DTO164E3_5484 [Paecilomyces variotii]|nr:hypothetical protein DTO164E3_5484 [Paecilomyces variotii]